MNKTNQNANLYPMNGWKTYRTRFLVRARQLREPLRFTDALGREHSGEPGDYLVESSDATVRIAPKSIFEDIYVSMPSVTNHGKPTFVPEMTAPEGGRISTQLAESKTLWKIRSHQTNQPS